MSLTKHRAEINTPDYYKKCIYISKFHNLFFNRIESSTTVMLQMQNQQMCKNQQAKLRNWQFKQGETKTEPEVGEKYPAAPKVSSERFNHTHPEGCNMHEINTYPKHFGC